MGAWCLCGGCVWVLCPPMCSCVPVTDLKRGGKKYHNIDIVALVCCGNLKWCHLNGLIWEFPCIVAVKNMFLLTIATGVSLPLLILFPRIYVLFTPPYPITVHWENFTEAHDGFKWCSRFMAQPSDDSLSCFLSFIRCRFSSAHIQSLSSENTDFKLLFFFFFFTPFQRLHYWIRSGFLYWNKDTQWQFV